MTASARRSCSGLALGLLQSPGQFLGTGPEGDLPGPGFPLIEMFQDHSIPSLLHHLQHHAQAQQQRRQSVIDDLRSQHRFVPLDIHLFGLSGS